MPLPGALPPVLGERYQVHEVVGRGGAATVYRATDTRESRSVAVKVLRPELALLVGPARFLREIEVAQAISHPNIVPVWDSGHVEGTLYYVMPFLSRGTLRDRLTSDGPLAVDDAVRIASDIARGLEAAHRAGVIHRDIKPENVLFDGSGCRLTDFGIARLIAATGEGTFTTSGLILGTPGYMSPEQAAGDKRLDGRSDLYSLGCVLFEMLAGEPPFTGPSPQSIAMRHVAERIPSLTVVRPDAPPGLARLVEDMLAKAPAARIPTATAVLERLSTPFPRTGRLARRAKLAIGGGALVMIAVVAMYLNGRPGRAEPHTIAVLPFVDQSRGGGLGYLAAGLTTDLTNDLASITAIRVIAPEVAGRLGAVARPESVAAIVGVNTLVAGSIDGTADSLFMTVRLLDVRTMSQLGSETIRRQISDVQSIEAALRDEVSAYLRSQLGSRVAAAQSSSLARNSIAWELTQRAVSLQTDASSIFHRVGAERAGPMLDRADSLLAVAETRERSSPAIAVARARLSEERAIVTGDLITARGDSGATVVPRTLALGPSGWRRIGLQHADRALRLRPLDPEALEIRANLHFGLWQNDPAFASDSVEAIIVADLMAVLDRRPDRAKAWSILSQVYDLGGRFGEADFAAHKALEADAFLADEPTVISRLMYTALNLGNPEAARGWCERGRTRHSNDLRFTGCRLVLAGWSGRDIAAAWQLYQAGQAVDTLALGPAWGAAELMNVAAVIARAGLVDSARRTMRRALAPVPAPPAPYLLLSEAQVSMLLGDSRGAVLLIDSVLRQVPQLGRALRSTARFRQLQPDPAFQALWARKAKVASGTVNR